MSTRTSIELADGVCRVVEVYVPRRGAPDLSSGGIRVRTFATDLPGAGEAAALEPALRRLRQQRSMARDAVVTVWGLGPFHRFLRLAQSAGDDFATRARAEVSEDLALFEARGGTASVAVSLGDVVRVDGAEHREISMVAASESAVRERISPVINAGFSVQRVVTPSLALVSLAYRHADPAAGAVAYVALGARAICIAVVRGGALLLARELSWGYAEDEGPGTMPARLGSELRRSMLYFRQAFRVPVEAVVLCGDMPSLRSLTAPLGSALGVPIRTLDSLSGVDGDHPPDPADIFREQVAALRVAMAAGADPAPHANLLQRPAGRRSRLAPGVVVAAGLAAAAILACVWWATSPRPSTSPSRTASPEVVAPPSTPATTPAAPVQAAPAVPDSGAVPSLALSSVLYSAERRLAIIDGHVVGIGDRVGSNIVFDIQPRAVIMESADGRRWTVQLRGPGAPQ